jgi:hypothetical protein
MFYPFVLCNYAIQNQKKYMFLEETWLKNYFSNIVKNIQH